MKLTTIAVPFAAAVLVALGCGSSATPAPADATTPDGGGATGLADAAALDGSFADAAPPTSDAAPTTDGGLADPNGDGPYAFAERDATATIATTTDSVAIHVAHPTATGPFPIVVFAHGFQLPPSQYLGYLRRLASFGYVALTVDFPTSLGGNDNPREAKDLIGGIDWVKADAVLGSKVDASVVGMSGHSLGGKLALLAATMDARVKASFVLDPVDSGPNGCAAPSCVVVKTLMAGLAIPTGFIGETTDATGGFQACAPAADNYTTLYAQAKTPSVQITASGANHMSFLDDVSTCGFTCSFCNAATATNASVNGMARAFMVAFYERYLRGNAAYETYLTGTLANARYVTSGRATLTSK